MKITFLILIILFNCSFLLSKKLSLVKKKQPIINSKSVSFAYIAFICCKILLAYRSV